MKNLNPITDLKKLEKIEIRYMPGNPRSYRLDLGKGVLNLEGREQVTKPGADFQVVPVAFRCLEDGLFGQDRKKWCEVYFINESGHLSVFMFHGYSVQNLSESARDLFYENKGLCEVLWDVKLVKKATKEDKPYYMAFFDFTPLKEEELKKHQALIDDIEATYFHIYRSDTMEAKTLYSQNYSTHLEPTRAEIEAEKERQSALIAEFSDKEQEPQAKAA
ncbi:MAG: hypothetical protein K9J37_13645 [Saprospiraceae bacterium]|nr:hypothetical protein [Saprospiraceae bacterium]MCF8250953.1 hypothetical protein [Saprospiraceae bacterium]MCF8281930.1 hypothetical protein [Bacteroidales bacterium]MCF8311917.1 hypothetical protein [Saprospiraceae bacterium]MCF8441925.1 hypothetical protein [Saprospiraceae bacterium]